MIGSVIAGRYRVDAEIGQGGMATVYKGMDLSLDRPVAVKVLREQWAGDPGAVERFRREAQRAARLSHPNIVQIYDTGVDEGRYFIIMEYLPEPDLKRILTEYAPLPLKKVTDVALQACEALIHAHGAGVVHRDVKPHNILFTAEGRARLSDFGIAAALGEAPTEDVLLGSAHYVAPELMRGAPPSLQSDIYSLGVVMFEALTGRTPFEGADAADILHQRLTQQPPSLRALNPAVSPQAEFVVLKAMSTDPGHRYASATELLADLHRLAGTAGPERLAHAADDPAATLVMAPHSIPPATTSPPPSTTAPLSPPREQSSGLGWGLVGFAAAVILMLAVALLARHFLFPPAPEQTWVTVPFLGDKSPFQAQSELEKVGLRLGRTREKADDAAAPGTIIDQHPATGERVPEGTEVDVVVAKPAEGQEQTVKVPSVRGLTMDQATSQLQGLELTVGEVTFTFDDQVPEGRVIKQEPTAGLKAEKGWSVNLVVSKGAQPAEPKTPPTPKSGSGTGTKDDNGEPPPSAPAKPIADFEQDLAFQPPDPRIRRFSYNVVVQAREPQQIEIRQKDDRDPQEVIKAQQQVEPGGTLSGTVVAEGSVVFEVLVNGEPVVEESFPYKEPQPSP